MVGHCPSGEKKDEQVANKEMANNGGQVERKISAQRLLDCTALASAKFEEKRDNSERVY